MRLLAKRTRNYIVVLVDLDRRVPIGFVLRRQEDTRIVLEEWGESVLNQIIEVSIDLSGNYKGLVHRLMPNAGCGRPIA